MVNQLDHAINYRNYWVKIYQDNGYKFYKDAQLFREAYEMTIDEFTKEDLLFLYELSIKDSKKAYASARFLMGIE